MTETAPEPRSLRQHKEIPFVRMDVFKGSAIYEGLAETDRSKLYQELCELRGLFDIYDVSLGDEPATAAELAVLGQFRQNLSRLAALARDTSPATARAIGSLEAAAHIWAGACDPSKRPFEPDETEAFVYINRLFHDVQTAAQIAAIAERALQTRLAVRSNESGSAVDLVSPLSPIEWLAGQRLPELYRTFSKQRFRLWAGSPAVRFVQDALEVMSIHPKSGEVRYSFEALRAYRRAATRKA
jgi:hypothetical protein